MATHKTSKALRLSVSAALLTALSLLAIIYLVALLR